MHRSTVDEEEEKLLEWKKRRQNHLTVTVQYETCRRDSVKC